VISSFAAGSAFSCRILTRLSSLSFAID
jgi:hypothetical protein